MNRRILLFVLVLFALAACDTRGALESPGADSPEKEGLAFDGPQHAAYSPFVGKDLKRVGAADRHSTRVPTIAPLLDERRIEAEWEGERVFVDVPLFHPGDTSLRGSLQLVLRHLDGTEIDRQLRSFRVMGWHTVSFELAGLPDDAEMADLAAYVFDYELDLGSSRQTIVGRRSLFEATHKIELQVLTADEYAVGDEGFVRVFARDPATGAPVTEAPVRIEMELPDGERVIVGEGLTDELGSLATEIEMPAGFEGAAKLFVALDDDDGGDFAAADVAVLRDARILLTTDKPMYQPGQTMHLRALALNRCSRRPMAGEEIVFEVSDAAGNKVFKERVTANEFGIGATTFQLARQVNMGAFRLKALVGESEVEKEVTVERYTLPDFGIEVTLDKDYYAPGDTITGTVSAQYFFGQPVAGGAVVLEASTFDVAFAEFAALQGTTNGEGLYRFSVALPDYLVGSSLEQGNAMIKIDVSVVDNADQEQTVSKTTVVAPGDVSVMLVPESGVLVPGVENVVYVVVSDPMGTPTPALLTLTARGVAEELHVGPLGLRRWRVTPETLPLDVTVDIEPAPLFNDFPALTQNFTLGDDGAPDAILLRTDRPLYEVGDTVRVFVFLATAEQRVFADVIHGGRTVATETIEVVDGVGSWDFEVDESLTGALQIHAYFLGQSSEIARDGRLVYVNAADDLQVTLTPDKDEYLPGEPANVGIAVTDGRGNPRPAALGISVVDEAVFALQEAQPGLLKVYYEMEAALATPRYQFAWSDLAPTSVIEEEEGEDGVSEERELRAEVSFAAQDGGAGHGVDLNTQRQRVEGVAKVLAPILDAQRNEAAQRIQQRLSEEGWDYNAVGGYLAELELTDPWGHPYTSSERERLPSEIEEWEQWYGYENHVYTFVSRGPNEIAGDGDDLSFELDVYDALWGPGWREGGGGMWFDGDMGGMVPGAVEDEADPSNGGGSNAIRVRSYFPETLFVDPAVLTDANGEATVAMEMADSITSWRMTALANSVDGMLGSTTAGMIVFQDFFVDIDFPATLTRGDAVSVPVAVFNYLDIPQTVTLRAQPESWLSFSGATELVLPLDPGQIDAVYFDVVVEEVGTHGLTVVAEGTAMSDAVQRTVLVEPDGRDIVQTASARFHVETPADQISSETITETISIPEENIDGAQMLLVKVYPGFFSQCVEGLDSMLRLPGGCLEQTASSAWPNALATRYMIETETITPEIEMKAQQYNNLGYQRVLTFECADGGFNWWEGDNPGNAVLSSLVIQFLVDSGEIAFVDEAVISRAQDWLVSVQQSDGSWTEERHLHAGNENLGGSSLRATSYIAWGLAVSGYEGPGLDAALGYIASHLDDEEDLYTIAMAVNALAVSGAGSAVRDRAVRTLHEARVEEEGGRVHWSPNADTMVGSWGGVADIETTALVGLALLHAHAYPSDVEGAITWLIAQKDPQGNWGYSTQATVLTLKLFVESLSGDAGETDADIAVSFGGALVAERHFDNFNKDVLWQVDLSDLAVEGDNELAIHYEGLGNLMVQVVSTFYLPYEEQPPAQGSLSIDVSYDRTQLAVDDTVNVTVTVTNHDPAQTSQILVDLGRPPGFTLHTEDLAQLRTDGVIAEYETTDRQILIYLDPLEAEVSLVFGYRLTAQYPITATVPSSSAAPYYNATDATETEPVDIEVQ